MMPAWMRRIQQTRFFHLCIVPAVTLLGATAFECAHHDITAVTLDCLTVGVKAAAPMVVLYVWGAFQHSPGSASFNPDGTQNDLVAAVRK